MIYDPTLSSQITDKICITSTSTSSTRILKENAIHSNAYTMKELRRQLKHRSQRNYISNTIQDLV